jgi:hypothetical protein
VKKRIISITLAVLMILSLSLATVAPAIAAEPETVTSNGSIKVDLLTNVSGLPNQPKVGEVILNTTGSGRLQMLTKVDSVPNLENWDVGVLWGYVNTEGDEIWEWFTFIDVLKTNNEGKGNAIVKLDIPADVAGGVMAVLFGIGEDLTTSPHCDYINWAMMPLK